MSDEQPSAWLIQLTFDVSWREMVGQKLDRSILSRPK
jgi:hypothetical protein